MKKNSIKQNSADAPMAPQSSNSSRNYRAESRPHSTRSSQRDEHHEMHEHDNSSSSSRNVVYRSNNFNRMRYGSTFESTDSSDSDTSHQSRFNRREDLPNQQFSMATRYAAVNQNIYLFNENMRKTFHRYQYYGSDEEVQVNNCPAFPDNQTVPANKVYSGSSIHNENSGKSSSETLFTAGTPSCLSHGSATVPCMYL
ncbi:unnamed protein product [Adineta ricciae]|uniref:Uncharacterized protein n=1 Tax=Adineta ricciae TaxID=249248 RepID=A0A814PQG2_ADIRI|nr:unnamed protein product [Adineta ricciae]CAF1648390.1 unnamed protein product [Adineta ricciae]